MSVNKVILNRLYIEEQKSLIQDEVVHHKNGCKTDNSISNLELMTRFKHSSIHAKMNNKIRNRNDLGQYI